MRKPRRNRSSFFIDIQRQVLVVFGVFILSMATAPVASAMDFGNSKSNGMSFSAFSFKEVEDTESKLEQKKKTLEKEAKELKAHQERIKVAAEEKNQLTQQLDTLQKEIADKKDMFVTIGRYAPDSAGNAYAAGNCTWYVKTKRPDIGTHWGNANQWLSAARAVGYSTGSKPKIGAIGTTQEGWAGHVVYVEKVIGTSVVISEMNYGGLYNMNTRTVNASEFQYIYALN